MRLRHLVLMLVLGMAAGGGCTPTNNSEGGGFDLGESIVGALDPTGYGTSGYRAGKALHRYMQASDLTAQQHYYIGRAVAANIFTQYPLYEDESATRYLNEVGATLAAASDMPYVYNGYRFAIADTDEANAFAVPGAYIIVTRGMLRGCQTEDELAAILAHEIAHIQREHGIQAIQQDRFKEFGKVVAVEAAGAAAGQSGLPVAQSARFLAGAAGDITRQLMVDGYSRKAEAEADRDAVALLQRVGYDPHALVAVLTKIAGQGPSIGAGRTHPSSAQRVEAVRALIKTHPVEPPPARQERFESALSRAVAR